jgi:DNA polymerase sigma
MECGYLREWYPHKLPGAPQELCLQIDVVCRGPGFKYGTLSAVVLTAISFAAVRAKPLVLLFKRLIRQNNLDNTYLGGLSSQSLTRMALTYLQTCAP